MATLNIVLVEPEIPQNTGNIARTCAATGARLHLVGPMGSKLTTESSSVRVWTTGIFWTSPITIVFPIFFSQNSGNFFYFSTKAQHIHSNISYPDGCYLVFGKETAGLPEELLLQHPESCVRIPMLNNPDARSLNLSNSVAIGVYEVLRQWNYPNLLCAGQLHRLSWD